MLRNAPIYPFKTMDHFSNLVLRHRKTVFALFIALTAVSVLLSFTVTVNYSMADYLPDQAKSTQAIRIMQDEFGGALPNARVLLSDVTVHEALETADQLEELDGVTAVTWLDDIVGRGALKTTPTAFLDPSVLEQYYKNGDALISVTIESGKEKDTVLKIRTLIGERNAIAGDAVNTASAQEMSSSEVLNATAILLPVILLILLLTTSSWIEPLLFLVSIGVAVLINMGTNAFFNETSFITQAISPILQLAVSLDYAIFLLHSFREHRMEYEPLEAMKRAMKQAMSSISASAATTVFGFLALTFMRFEIGPDLGLNLMKGVLLSFVSVMVFLPALTLTTYKLIDKTKHRKLIPDLKKSGKWLAKISMPCLILAVLIAVPCFLAQSSIDFMYGTGEITEATHAGKDALRIEERFGKENALVLLVPVGDAGREAQLSAQLSEIPHVTGRCSYAAAVGAEIPTVYLEPQVLEQFYSEHFARIILYTDVENGRRTRPFQTVKSVSGAGTNSMIPTTLQVSARLLMT
jgi:predicted RND superfamily exporter protein